MNNYEEVIDALKAGETLINFKFLKVKLEDGELVSVEKLKPFIEHPNFNRPQLWQIYKEPKWYENIPEGGVLCWNIDGVGRQSEYVSAIRNDTVIDKSNFKPLTKQEIQVFMDNAPEAEQNG